MAKPVIVVGASGHAKVVLEALRIGGVYRPIGMIDSFKPKGTSFQGLQVLGSEDCIRGLLKSGEIIGGFVAIGDNAIRKRITDAISDRFPEFEFVVAQHPSAVVAEDATVEGGTLLMPGAIVGPSAKIGRGCIVNTRASLDHDGSMEEFSSLAPGVVTGGNVAIGAMSAIGIGATLFHGITIGENTVVGGGSVVTKNVPAFSVAYGVPARVVRARHEGDRYL